MKTLYTEIELLSLGMIYDYSPDVIVVWNIYDKTRMIFVLEGQLWRKAGELVLGAYESLRQWESRQEEEFARADSARGDLVAVTSIKTYWKYDRNALPGFNIPVYRKVIEMEPTKYYLCGARQNEEIQLTAEEVVALDWVKY